MKLNMLQKLPGPGEKGFTLVEVLVVIGLLGLLAAVVIPNVIRFMNSGEEEARLTEWANIQTSVLALLVAANVHQLDTSHDGVQSEDNVIAVTCTDDDGDPYNLRDYLMGGDYPLRQAYDIASNGIVTVD